jgi:hypothetical protein
MIDRFDAIEQLAADSPGGAADQSSRPTGTVSGGHPCAWKPRLLGQHLVVRKVKERFDGLKRPTFRSASAP